MSAFVVGLVSHSLRVSAHSYDRRPSSSPTWQGSKSAVRCALEEPPVEAPPSPVSVAPPRRKSNIGIAFDKVTETIEDAFLHYSRLLRREKKKMKRPKVLVLGSGWGAHALIKVIETEAYDVTLVSPRNFFFFTPADVTILFMRNYIALLTSSSVGTVEFRSLCDPIRKANEFVDFVEAVCVDIDVGRRVALCKPSIADQEKKNEMFQLAYDHLVIAVGAQTSTFGIPGVLTHAFFLKELGDARKLRGAIIDRLERASLPTTPDEERERLTKFVVVGGGPTGCELAGELADFVAQDLRRKYKHLSPSLTLLQSGETILTMLEAELQQSAIDNFRKRNIHLITGAKVVEVSEREVRLKDGRVIPHGLCVWATGNAPRPLVTGLINKIPEQRQIARNKIMVDPWLRVVGAPRVYALGDCAESIEEALPATAQVAGQQGAYLARLLNKASSFDDGVPMVGKDKLTPAKSFQFLSLGTMSALGYGKALVQVETSKNSNITISGFLAYLLWVSVYLTKQVSFRSRVLVLFDWVKSQVFGRDVSRF